jgi:hypothetical protein
MIYIGGVYNSDSSYHECDIVGTGPMAFRNDDGSVMNINGGKKSGNVVFNPSYNVDPSDPSPNVIIERGKLLIQNQTNISDSYVLYVNGNAYATSYSSASDYRIKENIQLLDERFTVDYLKPVHYLNTKTGKQDIGLIAHELQEIFPELVNGKKDDEELQAINYIGLIPILIKEIQELKRKLYQLQI